MLVLALLGMLATAGTPATAGAPGPAIAGTPAGPADTSVRVTGTTLRFGLADTVLAVRGFASLASGGREGRCRFFGIDGAARLGLADGRLARAEFTVEKTSPHERAYVQDQLAAMGYRRRCNRLGPRGSDCDWAGRTQVRLTVDGARLKAVVTPAAPADAGATAAVPLLAETLGVSAPGHPGHRAEAAVRDAPRCPAPPALRAAGVIGRVWVLVLVDVDGSVLEAAVSRGIPPLDAAALECARRWRFEPRTFQGAPCRFRVEVPVTLTFD